MVWRGCTCDPPKPRSARSCSATGPGRGESADLVTAAEVTGAYRCSVALVEQPYRVAGRRSPAPARQLDAAWTTVVEQLRSGELRDLPLIVGGRSSGARVACRTAADTTAVAVLCLAFPLHPPRRSPSAELKTRQPELDAVEVPTLVVQGENDPFGMPAAGDQRTIVVVAGNHALKSDLAAVKVAIEEWLSRVLAAAPAGRE